MLDLCKLGSLLYKDVSVMDSSKVFQTYPLLHEIRIVTKVANGEVKIQIRLRGSPSLLVFTGPKKHQFCSFCHDVTQLYLFASFSM